MKAGYIQFDVKHSKEENLRLIEKYLSKSHCDLAVLPELCTCGYLFESREDLEKVAETVTPRQNSCRNDRNVRKI